VRRGPVVEKGRERPRLVDVELDAFAAVADHAAERHRAARLAVLVGDRDDQHLRRRVREIAVGQRHVGRGGLDPGRELVGVHRRRALEQRQAQPRARDVDLAVVETAERDGCVRALRRTRDRVERPGAVERFPGHGDGHALGQLEADLDARGVRDFRPPQPERGRGDEVVRRQRAILPFRAGGRREVDRVGHAADAVRRHDQAAVAQPDLRVRVAVPEVEQVAPGAARARRDAVDPAFEARLDGEPVEAGRNRDRVAVRGLRIGRAESRAGDKRGEERCRTEVARVLRHVAVGHAWIGRRGCRRTG